MEKTREDLIAESGRLERAIQDMIPCTCCDCDCVRRTTFKSNDMDRLIKQHDYKLKLIKAMKKLVSISMMVVIALTLIALCLPCLLIFSTGVDGEMTFWNWVGIGWLAMLVVVGKRMK